MAAVPTLGAMASHTDSNTSNTTATLHSDRAGAFHSEAPDAPLPADTSRVVDIDEVLVVSQPKEQFRLRRQPLSATSFSGSQLQCAHATDLRQLSAFAPSFVMPEYGSRLTSALYIRGIGSRINNPSVGIYLDGMPLLSKASYNIHFYQTERIDLLRGPQGTLYGQNTEGGLVKIYTRNPFSYQGTDILLGMGTHLSRQAEAAHYARLGSSWGLAVAAFYNGTNGFFHNSHLHTRADLSNEAGGRLRLMFRPSTRLHADLLVDYQYARQNAFAYGEADPATGQVLTPATNYPGSYKRNLLNTALKIGYQARRWELNSTTSYQLLRDDMLMDQDYMPTDYMHLTQRQLQNSLSEELTVKNRTTGPWRRASGVFASYQWLRTDAPVYFGQGITQPIADHIALYAKSAIVSAMADRLVASSGMDRTQAYEQATRMVDGRGGVSMTADMQVPGLFHTPQANVGVFHESSLNITPRLMATLGLRYDMNRVSVQYDTRAVMALTGSVMGATSTNTLTSALHHGTHDTYNQLLPKVGLTYTLGHAGSNVYALMSKGYRAGGYNIQMFSDILQTELMANAAKAQQGDYDVPHTSADYERMDATIAYKPETSWNYELGAHLNLLGAQLHADLAAFYMQIHDQQLSIMASGYGYGRMMVNAGKSYSCGIEAALRGAALDNRLAWSASYGLTHTAFKSYTEYDYRGTTAVEIDHSGKRVPYVPMHTLGAAADYTQPLRHSTVKEIRLGLNVSAQGSTYWDVDNTFRQPFYAVLGAHADVVAGPATITLWGRNLTNARYNTFAISSAASGSTRHFAQRGLPVQGGVEVRLHF